MIFFLFAASEDRQRASAATMNPKAAGSAVCVAGTISCSALASPPFGKRSSSGPTPKQTVVCCKLSDQLGSRDSKRRNSASAAVRLSAGDRDENAAGTDIYGVSPDRNKGGYSGYVREPEV